jgi:hypothetical protein
MIEIVVKEEYCEYRNFKFQHVEGSMRENSCSFWQKENFTKVQR